VKTTLVTVVNGEVYEKFSEDLFSSAYEFFHPTDEVECLMLYGAEGWPNATMHRPWFLERSFPADSDFVFLVDADMRFEALVGEEILPRNYGLTATLHPGYVDVNRPDLPYERAKHSACYIPQDAGGRYYCGGFYGGGGQAMRNLCLAISDLVMDDASHGVIPIWHDESALNKCLSIYKPDVILDPSYCYPEDDTWYRTFWARTYERKLVALDKTAAQRVGR
jgi:hypothetical protein